MKQKTKVNNSYKDWLEFVFGVLQGSILSLLSLNIFLADLFFALDNFDIANFSNNHTPYVYWFRCIQVIESLEQTSVSLFQWFEKNLVKGKADKCNFLASSSEKASLNFNNFKMENSKFEKPLGVKFDNRQIFDEQILDLCKEASWKIHALAHERTQVTYTYELTLSLKYSLIIAR